MDSAKHQRTDPVPERDENDARGSFSRAASSGLEGLIVDRAMNARRALSVKNLAGALPPRTLTKTQTEPIMKLSKRRFDELVPFGDLSENTRSESGTFSAATDGFRTHSFGSNNGDIISDGFDLDEVFETEQPSLKRTYDETQEEEVKAGEIPQEAFKDENF